MKLKLLLAFLIPFLIISTSCKKDSTPNEPTGDIPNTPRTSVSDDIAKKWLDYDAIYWGYSELSVYNLDTKVWFKGLTDPWAMDPRPANGIRFSKDGYFEINKFTSSGNGGLRSYSFFYMKGTVVQDGNRVTLHPTTHRGKYNSVSDPSLNYDKDLSKDPVILTYTVDPVEGGEQLTIKWADGTHSLFYYVAQ